MTATVEGSDAERALALLERTQALLDEIASEVARIQAENDAARVRLAAWEDRLQELLPPDEGEPVDGTHRVYGVGRDGPAVTADDVGHVVHVAGPAQVSEAVTESGVVYAVPERAHARAVPSPGSSGDA